MFHVIYVSETYLGSSALTHNDNLKNKRLRYFQSELNLIQGKASNAKQGGLNIYYRSSLPLKVVNIKYLRERIRFEIQTEYKLCNFILLC